MAELLFKVGDVVNIKDSKTHMTVTGFTHGAVSEYVICQWFIRRVLCTDNFKVEELFLSNKDEVRMYD